MSISAWKLLLTKLLRALIRYPFNPVLVKVVTTASGKHLNPSFFGLLAVAKVQRFIAPTSVKPSG